MARGTSELARGRGRFTMRTQTIVAPVTGGTRGRIAKIPEDEAAAASLGVGVVLHRVELGEIGLAPAAQGVPVNRELRERSRRLGRAQSPARAFQGDELTRLQPVQHGRHAWRAPK